LDCGSGGVELFDKVFEASKSRDDGVFELSVLQDSAVSLSPSTRGGEDLPEERMVDVTCVVF